MGARVNKRVATAALVLLVLGALTGCTSSPGKASAKGTSTSDTTRSGSSSPTPTPTQLVTPTAPIGTSLGAGERVWAAFSERGLSYDAWWKQLRPMLSDAARAVYVYDDPRNLPSMKVTDKIHLAAKAPDEPKYTAEVVVPTSKGVFRLDLERHKVGSPWLLYAIKFPRRVQ